MVRKLNGIAVAASLAFIGFLQPASNKLAAEEAGKSAAQTVTATAQCKTKGTELDGRRHACHSQAQTVTAPAGYVLAKETASGGLTSKNGSEYGCLVDWADPVDVIPGVPQPRTITLVAHARSPEGHATGAGWAECKYTVNMVPLPSH